MSPAVNLVAFLLVSCVLGLGFKGARVLTEAIGKGRKSSSDPQDFIEVEPSALDQILTWTGMSMLGAAFLNYFPLLHPGLTSPP